MGTDKVEKVIMVIGITLLSAMLLVFAGFIVSIIIGGIDISTTLPTKNGWNLIASGEFSRGAKGVDCYGRDNLVKYYIGNTEMPVESNAGNYFTPQGDKIKHEQLVIGKTYNLYEKKCGYLIDNELVEAIDCK